MKTRYHWYGLPYVLWSAVLILFPLLLILLFSLTEPLKETGKFVLTLRGYRTFFDPLYLNILGFSLAMAAAATLICLIVAYPLALAVSREQKETRNLLMLLLMVPMWINFLIKTYAWKPILRHDGLLNGILTFLGAQPVEILYTRGAVLLGMVYNFLPFMVLPILNSLIKIDKRLIEAARDLGSHQLRLQLKVILPLALPGIFSGITMTFMPSVSTFLIPVILGGGQDMMIGNLVEQQFLKTADETFGSAISLILITVIMLIMVLMNRLNRSSEHIR